MKKADVPKGSSASVFLIFQIINNVGYHPHILDIRRVAIPIRYRELPLCSRLYFAQLTMGVLGKFLSCLTGINGASSIMAGLISFNPVNE